MVLKQGDALSLLLSNLALEYTISRVQANQEGLKLLLTHQLLVNADGYNTCILSEGKHTIKKKNAEAYLVTSKEIGIEINAKKIKNIVSHEQNALKYYK